MANTKKSKKEEKDSVKVKKKTFTIEDLRNLSTAFEHLKKDEKCDEVNIFGVGKSKIIGVEPIKILKQYTTNEKDNIAISSLLPASLNDKKIKNKILESIDICNNFIRINFR